MLTDTSHLPWMRKVLAARRLEREVVEGLVKRGYPRGRELFATFEGDLSAILALADPVVDADGPWVRSQVVSAEVLAVGLALGRLHPVDPRFESVAGSARLLRQTVMEAGHLHPFRHEPMRGKVKLIGHLPSVQFPRVLVAAPASHFLIELGELTTRICACGPTGMTIGHAMAILNTPERREGIRDVVESYLNDVDRGDVMRSTYGLPTA